MSFIKRYSLFLNSKEGELASNIYESVKNNNKDKWYNILKSSKMNLIFPNCIVSKLKKLDFKINQVLYY